MTRSEKGYRIETRMADAAFGFRVPEFSELFVAAMPEVCHEAHAQLPGLCDQAVYTAYVGGYRAIQVGTGRAIHVLRCAYGGETRPVGFSCQFEHGFGIGHVHVLFTGGVA